MSWQTTQDWQRYHDMVKLPQFIRPPPAPTVPVSWQEIYNVLKPAVNHTLPTTGSNSRTETFNLGFTLKYGHILLCYFKIDQVGIDWTNKVWQGDYERRFDNSPDYYLTGYRHYHDITLDGSGNHTIADMGMVERISGISSVDLTMVFSHSYHSPSGASFVVRTQMGLKVYKPVSFTPWTG